MSRVKDFARRIPGLVWAYRAWRRALEARRFRRMGTEEVFTHIFRRNYWGGVASRSGSGSDEFQARALVGELPGLLRELGVTTLLDIPCGDFAWMREIDLRGINYIGADIVPDLVTRNQAAYAGPRREFLQLDLLRDVLPTAGLILCRDCLVHFSVADIRRALANISASGSRYLLTTTFTGRLANPDIATGQWRPINLEAPPFLLPRPLRVIDEQCTEEDGAYQDKSLGLWDVAALGGIRAAQPSPAARSPSSPTR